MSRIRIYQDGRPTPFFWRKEDGDDRTKQTVYKRTATGVKRMRGVRFDVEANEFKKT